MLLEHTYRRIYGTIHCNVTQTFGTHTHPHCTYERSDIDAHRKQSKSESDTSTVTTETWTILTNIFECLCCIWVRIASCVSNHMQFIVWNIHDVTKYFWCAELINSILHCIQFLFGYILSEKKGDKKLIELKWFMMMRNARGMFLLVLSSVSLYTPILYACFFFCFTKKKKKEERRFVRHRRWCSHWPLAINFAQNKNWIGYWFFRFAQTG